MIIKSSLIQIISAGRPTWAILQMSGYIVDYGARIHEFVNFSQFKL